MSCSRKTSDITPSHYINKEEFEKNLLSKFDSIFKKGGLIFYGKPVYAINLGEENKNFDFWHALCGLENAQKGKHDYNEIRAGKVVLLEDLLSGYCEGCDDFIYYETYHNGRKRDLRLKILCLNEKYLIILKKIKDHYIYITSFGQLSYDQVTVFLKQYNYYKKIKKPI